jgi:type VI secretion system secreted protein VgrG
MTRSTLKADLRSPRTRSRAAWAAVLPLLFAAGLLLTMTGSASAAATSVPLGAADSFGVLAGAGITNTGPTTINGDVGTYPTTSITGTSTLTVTGTNHGGDAVTKHAKTDLVNAYNVAAGEGPTTPIVADLGGQKLTKGVYNSGSTIGLTGTLTLDAQGDPDAVFVFQAGSGLTTASSSRVRLIGLAQSCNVFWQVGSSASLGTDSTMRGTVIALTSITLATHAVVDGRVLARNGDVTLDSNTISKPTCATTTPTTTSSSTSTASTTTRTTTTTPTTTAATTTAATTTTATTTAATTATTTVATTTAATTTAATTTAATTTAATTTAATTTRTTTTTPAPKKKHHAKKARKAATKAAVKTHAKPTIRHAAFTG